MKRGTECDSTLDGEHHWGKRSWLARGEDGSSFDQLVPENWSLVWACTCGERAPDELVEELVAAEAESRRIKALKFGAEPGEQGELDL